MENWNSEQDFGITPNSSLQIFILKLTLHNDVESSMPIPIPFDISSDYETSTTTAVSNISCSKQMIIYLHTIPLYNIYR